MTFSWTDDSLIRWRTLGRRVECSPMRPSSALEAPLPRWLQPITHRSTNDMIVYMSSWIRDGRRCLVFDRRVPVRQKEYLDDCSLRLRNWTYPSVNIKVFSSYYSTIQISDAENGNVSRPSFSSLPPRARCAKYSPKPCDHSNICRRRGWLWTAYCCRNIGYAQS